METYQTIEHGTRVQIRWVYDDLYQSEGSYAYDSEEETRKAEQEESEALASGLLVALGAHVERKAPTGEWVEVDSLWGIVIEPDESKLREFAAEAFDLENRYLTREELRAWNPLALPLLDLIEWATEGDTSGNPYCAEPVKAAIRAIPYPKGDLSRTLDAYRPHVVETVTDSPDCKDAGGQ